MPLTIKLNIKNPMPYLLISAAFFPISAAFFLTLEDIRFLLRLAQLPFLFTQLSYKVPAILQFDLNQHQTVWPYL